MTDPAYIELADYAAQHLLQELKARTFAREDVQDSPAVGLILKAGLELTEAGLDVPVSILRIVAEADLAGRPV
jgi:hypothetical protein